MKNFENLLIEKKLYPLRVKKKIVCELLGISVNHLRNLTIFDDSFPKPIKTGTKRQAGVYFDYLEIVEWHNQQLKLRDR
ncbi:transcriptional regulator [Acinetobacter sp. ANC 5579]|uniref:helix-turn-helix transcriptional regulator n=1 Tax=Acinetobacter amyesii TaxID=2942470 RepID=UPI0020BE5C41|nr:transcriptional regulator [Acinetobacter amyesii]MCL6236403.1 transcriptional regulator [Acinetobacter amyesii]